MPRVFQGGRELTQVEEHGGTPVPDPGRHHTIRPAHGGLDGGQPGRRPARENEGHAQAGEHLGLALGRAGAASLAQCLAQFTDPGLDVAEVA